MTYKKARNLILLLREAVQCVLVAGRVLAGYSTLEHCVQLVLIEYASNTVCTTPFRKCHGCVHYAKSECELSDVLRLHRVLPTHEHTQAHMLSLLAGKADRNTLIHGPFDVLRSVEVQILSK